MHISVTSDCKIISENSTTPRPLVIVQYLTNSYSDGDDAYAFTIFNEIKQ